MWEHIVSINFRVRKKKKAHANKKDALKMIATFLLKKTWLKK